MGAFANPHDTVTLHASWWDDGEEVVIREHVTYADRRAIEAALIKVETDADGDISVDAKVSAMNDVILQRMIVSWTFADAAGALMPVTLASIETLKDTYSSYILREINRLSPRRTKETRQD